jgi:hypothetical protein
MLKLGEPLRGDCEPMIANQPLKCKLFYPITIGHNVYISEENYNKIKKTTAKKFVLKINEL